MNSTTPEPKTTRPAEARPGEAPDDPGRDAGSLGPEDDTGADRNDDRDRPASPQDAGQTGPAQRGG